MDFHMPTLAEVKLPVFLPPMGKSKDFIDLDEIMKVA